MGYIKPVDLPVSSPYGMRGDGMHYGIDYSDGVAGHPIHAVGDGVVTYAAYEDGGFGNTVTITHPDGLKSGYGHMVAPTTLAIGQNVLQGQIIGFVGNTGRSSGPHLHLWMGKSPNPPGVIDPTPLLVGGITGDDEMTQEQMDILGTWMKDQRQLLESTLGQWLKDVEGRVNAHVDAAVAKIPSGSGGGLSEEQIRTIVRSEIRSEINKTRFIG